MKVKVVATGREFGTKITNAETGEIIEGVTFVKFEHNAHDFPKITLDVIEFEFDGEAEANIQIDARASTEEQGEKLAASVMEVLKTKLEG